MDAVLAGSILRLLTTVHDWCPNVRHLPKREFVETGHYWAQRTHPPMASACRSGLAVSSGQNCPRVTAPVSSTALEAGGGHGLSRVVPSVKGVTCVLRKCPHGACILYSSVSVTLVCISTISCSSFIQFFHTTITSSSGSVFFFHTHALMVSGSEWN